MDDVYRLIFRGEVLQGQHPSVVKKRLAKSLKLDEAQSEELFAGQPVVLKREADTKTAAKFQALFKEAGGRLRLMPVEKADEYHDYLLRTGVTDCQSTPGNLGVRVLRRIQKDEAHFLFISFWIRVLC